MTLIDRLLPKPEGATGPELARILARGGSSARIRAARVLGQLSEEKADELARSLLEDDVPGVRRAAVMCLALRGNTSDLGRLEKRLSVERCVWPLLSVAIAWVRCGGSLKLAYEALERAANREVQTVYGPRRPSTTTETSAQQLQYWLSRALFPDLPKGELAEAGSRPISAAVIRANLLERLKSRPHRPPASAIEALALQQHPADFETLTNLRGEGNRRGETTMLDAFGLHGDPRWIPTLATAMRDLRVAPGRAFAWRRLSAVSLGRIGSPEAAKVVTQALTTEAREFEGKPGAGLGIQYPVRSLLLWALGEISADQTAGQLIEYLGNITGTAMGGFYLPAIGALLKLPQEAIVPALTNTLKIGEEVQAAHALSVLSEIGHTQTVDAYQNDPREAVKKMAIALSTGGDV